MAPRNYGMQSHTSLRDTNLCELTMLLTGFVFWSVIEQGKERQRPKVVVGAKPGHVVTSHGVHLHEGICCLNRKPMSQSILISQAWWHTSVTPGLRRLRKEDHRFQTSLSYTERPLSQKQKKKKKKSQNIGIRHNTKTQFTKVCLQSDPILRDNRNMFSYRE